jgi:hypothetical protein
MVIAGFTSICLGLFDVVSPAGFDQWLVATLGPFSGSELEHAQDSLRTLLQLLIQHTQPPLTISRLEGDAVISYASKGSSPIWI